MYTEVCFAPCSHGCVSNSWSVGRSVGPVRVIFDILPPPPVLGVLAIGLRGGCRVFERGSVQVYPQKGGYRGSPALTGTNVKRPTPWAKGGVQTPGPPPPPHPLDPYLSMYIKVWRRKLMSLSNTHKLLSCAHRKSRMSKSVPSCW